MDTIMPPAGAGTAAAGSPPRIVMIPSVGGIVGPLVCRDEDLYTVQGH